MQTNSTCYYWRIVKEPGNDTLILQFAYGIVAFSTLWINFQVIWYFLRKPKKRIYSILLVLCISDSVVALLSEPVTIFMFSIKTQERACRHRKLFDGFRYFPCTFSWLLTLLIAIDRYILTTRPSFHQRYFTNRVTCVTIILTFFFSLSAPVLYSHSPATDNLIRHNHLLILVLMQVVYICCISLIYILLLRSVKSLLRNSRTTRQRVEVAVDAHLTKTILWIVCAIILTSIPFLITNMVFVFALKEPNSTVFRNLLWWPYLLLQLNSFLNSFIFLWRRRRHVRRIDIQAGDMENIGAKRTSSSTDVPKRHIKWCSPIATPAVKPFNKAGSSSDT